MPSAIAIRLIIVLKSVQFPNINPTAKEMRSLFLSCAIAIRLMIILKSVQFPNINPSDKEKRSHCRLG
jgi:hypothetical protein